MSFIRLLGAIVMYALFAANSFGAPVSDSELKSALVGTWVNPPDSGTEYLPARQIFHHDGTTLVYIYATAECREPAAVFEGRWSVVNGMLITQITRSSHPQLVAVGQIEQVAIIALDPNRVTINLNDDVYTREKSETCFPANAHRT